MIKIELFMNSGARHVVHVKPSEGKSDLDAAEKFTENFDKIGTLSSQDEVTGSWFFVNCSDVSFVSASVVKGN